jgi:hypothetical protein
VGNSPLFFIPSVVFVTGKNRRKFLLFENKKIIGAEVEKWLAMRF